MSFEQHIIIDRNKIEMVLPHAIMAYNILSDNYTKCSMIPISFNLSRPYSIPQANYCPPAHLRLTIDSLITVTVKTIVFTPKWFVKDII